jgi:hypothetical protein
MGSVYLAEHVHLGRPTAIKVLRRELGTDPDAEARFRREALLAARIDHASVAQVYDFDRTPEGEFFLAMEFIDGETVAARLRREGPFPLRLTMRVVLAVAGGLDRAHSLGIVHRDIKPENIMLAREGQVKLLDFGVARPMDSTSGITSSGFAVGTPAYMSPEQLVGEAVGPASDVYSLGTVVYEVLTGQQPHTGVTFSELRAKRLSQPPTPVHMLRDTCPSTLSDVVARALEVEPKGRWPTALAFAEALAAVGADSTGVSGSLPALGPPAEQLDRWAAHFEALRFAGRDREIRWVRDTWAAARAGRTAVLWIEGEEGAGKSSFFELARREAATDGALEVSGRGYEGDGARPFGPWLGMLRTGLDCWAGKERPWPGIAALIDARQDTPAPERAGLHDEVAALIHLAAQRGPLLLGMEDVNWCDPASIALLESLVHHTSGCRVLFVVTAIAGTADGGSRPREMRERLRRLDNVVWVALRPLSYEAVAGWLTRALGRDAPEELVRYVYGNTEGNAFFIEQVVRSLLERGEVGLLSGESARVALAAAPPPEAVTDVVERRLRGMSPATREILQVAAVAGREFDVDLLVALSRAPEDAVLAALDEAEAAGVLAPVQRGGGGDWYRFDHNKIAHVLAQTINARRRRRLHREIAEALTRRPDAQPGTVAWHWYHAGDRARAAEAARAAARHALAVHDYDDALTLAVLAAETGQTAGEKLEAHELRGDALRRLDRHGEAAAAYARARLTGDAAVASGSVLRYKELRTALVAGTVSPGVAVAEAAKLAADAASGLTRGAVELLLAEAHLAAADHHAAIAAAEQALSAARETGHRAAAADALVVLGHAQVRQESLPAAAHAASDARAIYLDLADPYGLARVAELESAVALGRGDLALARQALDDAARHAERAGVTRMVRQFTKMRADLAG